MRRVIYLLIWLMGVAWTGFAQGSCFKYEQAMRQGRMYLKKSDFQNALIEFQAAQIAARECDLDPEDSKAPADSLQAVFAGLQRQRDDARAAEEKARRAEILAQKRFEETQLALDRTDLLNRKNERLINSLHFYKGRFALAVRKVSGQDKYGFIDKNGNTRIDFRYDRGESFKEDGFARVSLRANKFLLDTLGRQYRLVERTEDLTTRTEALDLTGNNLRELNLPDSILQADRLKVLLLNGNSLMGKTYHQSTLKFPDWMYDGRETLPWIDALESLIFLDLSDNGLFVVPQNLSKAFRLETLNLSENEYKELPEPVAQLKSLAHLDFSSNSKLQGLHGRIGEMTGLKELILDKNNLKTLPDAIGQLNHLEILDLSENKLQNLPEEFGKLSQLKTLDLENNQLLSLPNTMGQLAQLRILNLRSNKLNRLSTSIGRMAALEELDLYQNELEILPVSIGQLKRLKNLNLSENELKSLPPQFGGLTQLRNLDLSKNYLRDLVEEFGKLSQLRILNLEDNQLVALPNTIGQLNQVWTLNLSNNRLVRLPESFGQMTALEELDLYQNELRILPSSIGQLSRLQKFNLRNNRLEKLPVSTGQMVNLEVLDLGYNSLRSLPASLAKLNRLRRLDVSWNQLQAYPTVVDKLSNLEKLDLEGNPFISNLNLLEFIPQESSHVSYLIRAMVSRPRLYVDSMNISRVRQLPEGIAYWEPKEALDTMIQIWQNNENQHSEPDSLKELFSELAAIFSARLMISSGADVLVEVRGRDEGFGKLLPSGNWPAITDFSLVKEKADSLHYSQTSNQIGWYRSLAGKFSLAEEIFQQALILDPNNKTARKNFPPTLLFQGKYEAAKTEYLRLKDQTYGLSNYPTYKEAFLAAFERFEQMEVVPEEHRETYEKVRSLLME